MQSFGLSLENILPKKATLDIPFSTKKAKRQNVMDSLPFNVCKALSSWSQTKNKVVVLDRTDYDQGILKIIGDTSKFRPLKEETVVLRRYDNFFSSTELMK